MIKLDDNLLKELGLGELPEEERRALLEQMYETLQLRVGMTIARQMSDEQLDEFEQYIDTDDKQGALKWLETNFPTYKQVVADELEKLKDEIKRDAGQIAQVADQQNQQSSTQTGAPETPAAQNQPTPQPPTPPRPDGEAPLRPRQTDDARPQSPPTEPPQQPPQAPPVA